MRHRIVHIHCPLLLIAMMATAVLAAARSGPVLAADDYVFVDSFESTDCSQPLTCPVPAANKLCIAGQLTDAAAASPLRARFNVGLACGSGAIGGPCDLAVTARDATAFSSNPFTSIPLAAGEIVVDGCGRYRFSDLSASPSPYLTIVADNAPGNTTYMLASTPHPSVVNQSFTGVTALTARHDDVAAWGLMAGQDYLDNGALLLAFSTNGIPTAGVSVAGSGTARYFSDSDAQRFSVSTTATATGANGSVLYIGAASLAAGGESGGCAWPGISPNATFSVAGVVSYWEFACK